METQEYGVPSEYLSREKQLQYRAITKLLELTESFGEKPHFRENPRPGGERDYKDKQLSEIVLRRVNTLFVRDDETVSLLAHKNKTSYVAVRTYPPGMSDRNTNQATSGTDKVESSISKTIPSLEAKFATPDCPALEGSVIQFFISQLRDFKNQPDEMGPLAGKVPYPFKFSTHCNFVVDLVRKAHGPRSQFTKYAARSLRYYVLMASNCKMLKRFRPATGLLPYLQLRGSNPRFTPESHALAVRDLSLDPPNYRQYSVLATMLSRFADNNLSDDEALRFGWNKSTQEFDLSKPAYDKDGRERLQTLMALSLLHIIHCLKELKTEIAKNVPNSPDPIFEISVEDAVSSVEEILSDLWRTLSDFFHLQYAFREILETKHLRWLQTAFNLDTNLSTTLDTKSSTARPRRSNDIASIFQRQASQQPTDEGDIAEAFEFISIESDKTGKDRWAKKAFKYLQIVTLYMDSLLQLTPTKGKVKGTAFLQYLSGKMEFKTLEIRPGPEDAVTSPISSILNKARLNDSGSYCLEQRSAEEIDLIKMWLKESLQESDPQKFATSDKLATDEVEKMLESKTFFGTVHPEAVQLALTVLATDVTKSRDFLVWEEESPIGLPSRNVIKEFADLQDIHTVSRTCCPACYALTNDRMEFHWYHNYFPKARRMHTAWTCHALPHCLPRDMADKAYNLAYLTAVYRLNEIVCFQRNLLAIRKHARPQTLETFLREDPRVKRKEKAPPEKGVQGRMPSNARGKLYPLP